MDTRGIVALGLLAALAAMLYSRRSWAGIAWTENPTLPDGTPVSVFTDAPTIAQDGSGAFDWTESLDPWTWAVQPAGGDSGADTVADPWTNAYNDPFGMAEQESGTMAGSWAYPSSAAPYLQTITAAETRYGLPPLLLGRLLYEESRFRPDIISGKVASPAGALGIAQFMPATAASLGINPLKPTEAIFGAARYLRSLYDQTGSWSLALAAYNWGIGNVLRKGISAAPTETQNYVASITADVPVA